MIAYAAAATNVTEETTGELAKLFELLLTRIPLWIAAFIVIILSVLAAKIVRRIVENKLAEKGIEEEHKELQILGGRMSYTVILTIGITIGLKIAGIDLTTILAAVAFGIGFALKDLIMNFLAGIMILVGRHFSIGDFIDIGGTVGKVTEIQSRVTVLQATDGTKVIVPNSELFKKQVTNFTGNPFRRLEVTVGIDFNNNLENALKVCLKAVKETKGILVEPRPAVLVNDFGEYAVNVKVRAWVESRSGWVKIKSDLVKNIKDLMDAHGITIRPLSAYLEIDEKSRAQEKMLEEEKEEEKRKEQTGKQNTPKILAVETVPVTTEEMSEPLRPLGERKL